jgi:hypothetical protein
MEVQLYSVSVGGKHYVSGTVYTPSGILQHNAVLDNFEQLFFIFPTFATFIDCYRDEACMDDNNTYYYYLIYRNEDELQKMLTFMDGASVQYLNFIPSGVVKRLDIHVEGDQIRIGGVNILQNFDCKVIGSIPATLTITRDYIAINGVKIGERDESGDYSVCDEIVNFSNGVDGLIPFLLSCYYLKHYKGTPFWSEVLRTWCGIRTSLKT